MGSLEGVGALNARIDAVSGTRIRGRVGKRWQILTIRNAKIRAPRRTSNLSRTIHEGELSEQSASVVVSANYAAAIELGRRAVEIRPRPGRVGRNGRPAALAWGGARRLSGSLRTGASPTNFARVVHQPARAPRPFLAPAAREALEDEGIVAEFVVAWNGAA